MNSPAVGNSSAGVSRRAFLGQSALGAASFGIGAEAAAGTTTRSATPAEENPWRYDVDSLRRVDPALIRYDRVSGFPVGDPHARRLALGSDGRIRVAAGKAVIVFSETGERLARVETDEPVRAMAVGPDGLLYVGLRNRVETRDAKGRRIAQWPVFTGKSYVTAIAPSGADVFVADAGNRVVYRCDSDGRVNLRLGEKNADRQVPGLVLPSPFLDVEPGADGLLRVNNPGRHKVEIYTRDGDLEQSWGRPGVAIDAFCGCCNPIALAMLPEGAGWVTAEKGLPRVKVYTPDGRFESVVAGPEQFAAVASEDREARTTADTVSDGLDVAVDAGGRVWVLDLVGGTVQVFRKRDKEGTAKPA